MNKPLTVVELHAQSSAYQGTGGCSEMSHGWGFQPAFWDTDSGAIYPSRFADGRLAPLHTLNGLPDELVLRRDEHGDVSEIKPCIISGFEKDGQFFTRDQCAALLKASKQAAPV